MQKWKIDDAPDLPMGIIIDDEDGLGICTMDPELKPEDQSYVTRANARLIAAAPELLEACKLAKPIIMASMAAHGGSRHGDMIADTLHRVTRVIAAAEGK